MLGRGKLIRNYVDFFGNVENKKDKQILLHIIVTFHKNVKSWKINP